MDTDQAKLPAKIKRAAKAASEFALEHFGRVKGELKPDMTYMTEVDTGIEAMLRRRLPRILPGSVVVGEENLNGCPDCDLLKTEYVWVIDPVDGTAAFIEGLPTFCVSIGLMRRGRPYAGVIMLPATGDVYEAVRGHGAFYNGIPVSATGRLMHEAPLIISSKSHLTYRITYPGKTRNMGSAALNFALVARAVAIGAIARPFVWDLAAAAAILLEAGASVRYLDGSPIDWRAMMVSRDRFALPVVAASKNRWKKVASWLDVVDLSIND